jgi:hypothetical protein
MFVVLDRSASMADTVDGQIATPADTSKWTLVTGALNQLLATSGGSFNWGLKAFPEDGSECAASTVTSRIDVAVATGNVPAIQAAIAAVAPAGNGTPTAAAIQVAASYLMSRPATSPRYLLLVTDGEPGCAVNPPGVNAVQARTDAINAVSAAAQMGIHTFVVGVATTRATDSATLSALAVAGLEPRNDLRPGAPRYYAAETQDELTTALDTITAGVGHPSTCAAADAGADGGAPASGSLLFSDDFEDGMWDQRWLMIQSAVGTPSWSVIADGTNHVLTETAVSQSVSQVAGGNVSWTDQIVEAKVKLTAPGARVQVAARFLDSADYYFLELSDTNNLKIRKRVVAVTTDLVAAVAAAGTTLAVGTWYTVGLKVQGNTLVASFNGAQVASVTDTASPLAAGGIGLGTVANNVEFDDVRVTAP